MADKKRKRVAKTVPDENNPRSTTTSDNEEPPVTRQRHSVPPVPHGDAEPVRFDTDPSEEHVVTNATPEDTEPAARAVADVDRDALLVQSVGQLELSSKDFHIDPANFPLKIDDATKTRLERLATTSKTDEGEYTMTNLPLDKVTYGQGTFVGRMDPTRFAHVNGELALFQFMGEINTLDIGSATKRPHKIYVSLRPRPVSDWFAGGKLLADMSNPPRDDTLERGTLFFGKFMTSTPKGKPAPRPKAPRFNNVWDWTDASLPEAVHATSADFAPGDIVLVAAYINRWHIDNPKDVDGQNARASSSAGDPGPSTLASQSDTSPQKGKVPRRPWVYWRASYELVKMTLLHRATPQNMKPYSAGLNRETESDDGEDEGDDNW